MAHSNYLVKLRMGRKTVSLGQELNVKRKIASEVRHHDVDVTAFGYEMGQVPGMPAGFAPDPKLIETARACRP